MHKITVTLETYEWLRILQMAEVGFRSLTSNENKDDEEWNQDMSATLKAFKKELKGVVVEHLLTIGDK